MSFAVAAALTVAACPPERVAHWERYAAAFVTADGRVVDPTGGGRSTSEGQAYGLFHALVANDRARFDAILAWARDNLAAGNLRARLPAWHWGRGSDGAFRVLDRNPASDADLWMGYALVEAGRLWARPDLGDLGLRVLANVVESEVATLPGLGPTLLPAPHGFEVEPGYSWRLNPSYLPLQLLRRFAAVSAPGPWAELIRSSERILVGSARGGISPDWSRYEGGRFVPDATSRAAASYDAIRVPLWVGMLPASEPLRPQLFEKLSGLLEHVRRDGAVPGAVETRSGRGSGQAGPPGFQAALLPLAEALGDAASVASLRRSLAASLADGRYGAPPTYYDQNLVLFGLGFVERRYRFAPDGSLEPRWADPCARR